MIMKYTEGNDIQEKPIFAIENDDNNTSSQELLDEPTIIIESNGDMEYNASSDSIKSEVGCRSGVWLSCGLWQPWCLYLAATKSYASTTTIII